MTGVDPDSLFDLYKKSAVQLYSKLEIARALDDMAKKIERVLGGCHPVVLCVMTGGLVVTSELLLRLDFPLVLDYLHVTRYRGETKGAALAWLAGPHCGLEGREVLLVDDILDEGITLHALIEGCYTRGASRVYSAVLVDKLRARKEGAVLQADFSALTVPDRYIFGYGMDYQHYLRNAPGIFTLN